jgi:Carboxypeptidase regulatory-like domain/TonB dependent receptor
MIRNALRMIWLPTLALLCLSGAAAQNRPEGVAVTGTVTDQRHAPVVDATVTLHQEANETPVPVRTDTAGRFHFDGVADGNYSIEVEREGFARSVTPLQVSGKAPAPLTIKLSLSSVVTKLTVVGEEPAQVSTDISENLDTASVDQNLLEKVPVFDQDYVTTMSVFLDAGAIGTSGVQTIVNGVEVTSVTVSASAVQEVRINQNPYSAEYARPGRGGLEIITKEAASDYHGTFNFIFRDSALNARDPFALVRSPEQRRIFEGAFSGPIGHSKSWSFMLSGRRLEEDLQSIVFAQGLSGPIQDSVPSPRRDTLLTLHVGHEFSENHVAYWEYTEWEYPSWNQGVGGFVLPEAATNSDQWEREWVFNDRLTISPHLLFQFRAQVGWEHHVTTSVNPAPKIVVQDAFTSGGAQTDVLGIERNVQLSAVASWTHDKHLVKFGLNVPDLSHRDNTNHSNFGSTYYFTSLSDYQANHPYAFRQQQGMGTVSFWDDQLAGFVQDEYRFRPNLSFSLGLRYSWQNHLIDNTQFAPRLAFAYSPDKKRKTVIRGGAGVFYDRTGANPPSDLLLYNGLDLRNVLILNPTYPDPFSGGESLATFPTDVVQFDPSIREPYSIQYSLGVERQLGKRTTLAVTYNGSRGINLFRSRDTNAPLAPDYTVIPNPAIGILRNIESSGRQAGNALEITLRGQITRYATGLIQYTLSRTDNNTSGITWFPANQYDLSGEWSRADFDQRHRLNLLESFSPGKQLTFGLGVQLASGKPYTMIAGQDLFNTGILNARPAGVPRNSLEGPAYADLDLRMSRDFYFSKAKKDKGKMTTFGFEAFNVLNHVNYAYYVGNLQSHFFGQAVSALPSRRLQVTARFKF